MQTTSIKQIETYARYHPEVVSLSQGIPFRHSDTRIRYAVIKAMLQNNVDAYADPQGMIELREAISTSLRQEKMVYSSEEIIVTAGVTEGLAATLLSILTSERNEVIVPTPAYSAYFRAIEVAKGKIVSIPLHENEKWQLDSSELEKRITSRSRAILLCNPNNPTGSIYSREVLESLCKLAQKHNLIIILDEVYKNMIFNDSTFYTPCVDKSYKKCIIRIVSFSKDFSLTGWRVGFLHADRELIQKILPVHDALINCVPVISQYAALAALENADSIVGQNKKIYQKHMMLMKKYLDTLSDHLSYVMPQGAYYFFPRFVKSVDVEKFCLALLQEEHVAVVPGNDFGLSGENHIRICFGRSEESIKKGMEGLTRFLNSG